MKNTPNKRIEVAFNQVEFEKAVAELNNAASLYNKALDCFEKITNKREIQQMDLLESYITSKTGFKNIPMSATLLEVNDQYFFLNEHLSKLQPEAVDVVAGTAVVKQSILDAAKETFTTYLNDTLVEDYHLLEQACVLLNRLQNPSRTVSLNSDYNGKWSVNKLNLNNSIR